MLMRLALLGALSALLGCATSSDAELARASELADKLHPERKYRCERVSLTGSHLGHVVCLSAADREARRNRNQRSVAGLKGRSGPASSDPDLGL